MNTIPTDANLHLSSFLTKEEFFALKKTSKHWRKEGEKDQFWRLLSFKEWGHPTLTASNGSWKERYKVIRGWQTNQPREQHILFSNAANSSVQVLSFANELYKVEIFEEEQDAVKITPANSDSTLVLKTSHEAINGYQFSINSNFCVFQSINQFKIFSRENGELVKTVDIPDNYSGICNERFVACTNPLDGKLKGWDLQDGTEFEINIEGWFEESQGRVDDWDRRVRAYPYFNELKRKFNMVSEHAFVLLSRKHFFPYKLMGPYVFLQSVTRDMLVFNLESKTFHMMEDFTKEGFAVIYSDRKVIGLQFHDTALGISEWDIDNPGPPSREMLTDKKLLPFSQLGAYRNPEKPGYLIPKWNYRVQDNLLIITKTGSFLNWKNEWGEAITYVQVWNLTTKKIVCQKKMQGCIDLILSIDPDKWIGKRGKEEIVVCNYSESPFRLGDFSVKVLQDVPKPLPLKLRIKNTSKDIAVLAVQSLKFLGIQLLRAIKGLIILAFKAVATVLIIGVVAIVVGFVLENTLFYDQRLTRI